MRQRFPVHRARLALAGLVVVSMSAAVSLSAQAQVQDDELANPTVRVSIANGSGARALGMGGAFLARPDDGTAASWNPAGLSYLRRLEVSAAGLWSSASAPGRDPATTEIINEDHLKTTTADFVSAAFPFEGNGVTGSAQISFQRAIPFGGTRRLGRSRDRQIDLNTTGGFDVVAAGMGLRLSRSIRFGATVNRWVNGYTADFRGLSLDDSRPPAERQTKVSISGWNMNAGLIWTPIENLNIGAVGKTPFDADVSEWRHEVSITPDERVESDQFRSGLSLRFPGALGFGASWRIASPLTVSADYTRAFWSKAAIMHYFQFTPRGDFVQYDHLPFPDIVSIAAQQDTEQFRVGAEYVLFLGRLKCPVRIGYFNDRQYFRSDDPNQEGARDGPAPRFNAFTAGSGIAAGNFLVDVAYVQERGRYLDPLQRTNTTHRVFVSLIFRYADRY
jgi:hypothetical protein